MPNQRQPERRIAVVGKAGRKIARLPSRAEPVVGRAERERERARRAFLKRVGVLGLAGLVELAGCQITSEDDCPDCGRLAERFAPVDYLSVPHGYRDAPWIDLPRELREWNWGGGSCVHATLVMLLRWQGRFEEAEWWRRTFAGGEYANRLHSRLDAAGLRYAYTVQGDDAFVEWAIATRRGAGVTWGGNHMVCLVHLDDRDAGILDNNAIDRIKWQPRQAFLREWRRRGGWAVTPVYLPPPPDPWM